MTRLTIALALCFAGISASAANFTPKVIYGEDNRRDLFQITDPRIRTLARASAALMNGEDLKEMGPNSYYLQGKTYREEFNLCPSEPFLEQPSASFCSGVLIADDLFFTAGHCLEDAKSCANMFVVFDYSIPTAGANPRVIPKSNVYGCKSVLYHANAELNDYALLVLEKPVKGRMPVPFRRSGTVALGTPLIMIGHPSGLPQKIDDGAKVLSYDRTGFNADLDAFYNNSGSPVFNARTFELEGLLVEGEDEDYVKHPVNQCEITHRCTGSECIGESSSPMNDVIRRELEKWSER